MLNYFKNPSEMVKLLKDIVAADPVAFQTYFN